MSYCEMPPAKRPTRAHYDGPIEVGMIFIWGDHLTGHARAVAWERIRVTRIDGRRIYDVNPDRPRRAESWHSEELFRAMVTSEER